jgi:biotin transporter BioY
VSVFLAHHLCLESAQDGEGRIGIQGLFGPALGFFAALVAFIRLVFAFRPWRTFFLIFWLGLGPVLGFGFRPVAEWARIPWPPDFDFNLFKGG